MVFAVSESMENSRLWSVLKTLSAEERKQFDDFVRSPFFNKNARVIRFWQALQPALSEGAPAPAKPRLLKAIAVKGEVAQEQAVHDHASYLLRLAEQFLAHVQGQHAGHQSLELLGSLLERGLDDHFLRMYQKRAAALEAAPLRDGRHYLGLFQAGGLASALHGRLRDKSIDHTLRETVRALDVFYLATRLKYSCEQANRALLANQPFDPALLQVLLPSLSQPDNPYRQEPVIAIYYNILRMISDPDRSRDYYTLLTELLRQEGGKFNREEQSIMYAFAMNHCTRQINAGKPGWMEEMFRLYQTLLAGEVLIGKDGFLAHEYVKNITTVGLRLQEFDWVNTFLDTYRPHIAPEHRDNAYFYNLAALHFEQQQYRDALRLLQKVEFTDARYHLNAKIIQAKIYYALDETDSLTSLVKAQRVFLKRSPDVPQYHLHAYDHFFRFTHKAALIRQNKRLRLRQDHAQKATALLEQLAATPDTASAQWIRAQLEALC
jgi:hypothetical protein